MTYKQIKFIKQKCKDIVTLCNAALPNSDNEYISVAIQDRLNSLIFTDAKTNQNIRIEHNNI